MTKNEKINAAVARMIRVLPAINPAFWRAAEALSLAWALPEDEPAPGGQEERRKWFLLGMAEAEAVVRKQRVDGMTPIDPAKARDAAADCISIRACALHDFTLPATGERERGFREGIEAAAKVADSGTKSGTSYAPYARRLATSIRAVRAPAPSAPTTEPQGESPCRETSPERKPAPSSPCGGTGRAGGNHG